MGFEEVLTALAEESVRNIPQDKLDYINDDGLLCCGKCRTPKQVEIVIGSRKLRPLCLCKCEEERVKEEDRLWKKKQHKIAIDNLRKECFSRSDMSEWTFENDDMSNEKITDIMKRYVANFVELSKSGQGLLLYGGFGKGKTFAACEVANALIDKGYPVLVTNFAQILNRLQNTFERQEFIDSLNYYRLIVIDDLGIERDSAYAKEQVFNVIDARYRAGLPMIITTNLTLEELKNPTNTENRRIYDRILERCFPIEVKGGNHRRKAIRESYNDISRILGV